jgi:uncharacterized membrane protein YphA (DoxX/SURF4 family)
MDKINKFITALDVKTDTAYALIRIYLGIALAVRGWMILSRPEAIVDLGVGQNYYMWASVIGVAHFLGGILIALGFLVRVGALIQIPILVIATFYVYRAPQLMMGGQSIELAALVLFLLCIYLIFGAGIMSVRHYFALKND